MTLMRKMSRILVRLLVIMLLNEQSNGHISFADLKTIIKWGDAIFIKGIQYYDAVDSLTSTDSEKINQSLKKLNEISSELRSFSRNTEIKLDKMMNTLLINLRVSISLQPLKSQLTNYLNTVKRYYDDAIDYGIDNKTFTLNTLTNFAHLVLSTSDNLPATLQKIHQLFTNRNGDGYLQLLLNERVDNLPFDCDRNISAQQEMYFTYISVIIAEMQGFDVLSQVYLIKQIFERDHYNYTNELILGKDRYRTRLMDYNNIMSQYLSRFPREIRRCDVDPPERNINFIEVEGVARARLWHESTLLHGIKRYRARSEFYPCWSTCHKITQGGPELLFGNRVTNCQYIGGRVKVCRAAQGSHREYLWWKNDWATYGHDEICHNESVMSGNPFDFFRGNCEMCVCSEFKHWESAGIRRHINLSPQLSDVENNMIVTGVQFIIEGAWISLRIQENRFLSGGLSNGTGSWKRVSMDEYGVLIDYDRRSMYLDDVMVPDGYAVTGIGFEVVEGPSGFQLRVHATPFNLNTGELDMSRGKWIEPDDYNTPRLPDYDRPRVEIDMGNADDPTRGSAFNHDPSTNKFIKFTHTSLHEDAGQTTIPLIETLPVESMSTFPLSGIGISFKGRNGFGGYVAPRIYTMDVSKYIGIV